MSAQTGLQKVSLARILGYALGGGAVSISINGLGNFAMLYYTQVLGLSAAYAGIALSITTLWDAVTNPVMGHISDNTRSRFGRHHPYLLWGGLALAVSFLLLWVLPERFSSASAVFWCVLLTNLALRTADTVFVVPYTALGFEICPDYVDRSRLQGVCYFINQVTNFVFGAFAWSLFFRDKTAADGSRIDGTLIRSNYLTMGAVLACAAFAMILLCLLATRRYAADSRHLPMEGNSVGAFFRDIGGIFKDRLAWHVFGFFGIAQLGMLLTSQVQIFTYVHYMQFTSLEKTCVHGGGMLAFALGSLCLSRLVKRFDKKQAGYIGIAASIAGGLLLFALFTCGLVAPRQTFALAGCTLPLAVILFGLGQGLWWGGSGILAPLAVSMIADISEINKHRTGLLKDGGYSSVFSFLLKATCSGGLLITGWLVTQAGIAAGEGVQTAEAARNISIMTFLSGPLFTLLSLFILMRYPVDRAYMERLAGNQPSAQGERRSFEKKEMLNDFE